MSNLFAHLLLASLVLGSVGCLGISGAMIVGGLRLEREPSYHGNVVALRFGFIGLLLSLIPIAMAFVVGSAL